jgi:hypothetical protein
LGAVKRIAITARADVKTGIVVITARRAVEFVVYVAVVGAKIGFLAIKSSLFPANVPFFVQRSAVRNRRSTVNRVFPEPSQRVRARRRSNAPPFRRFRRLSKGRGAAETKLERSPKPQRLFI